MNRRRLVIGTVVLSLALAACGSSSKSSSTTGTTAAGGTKTFSGTITLAVNPWDGSAANAAPRLHCHRNTVINRLQRLSALLGRPLEGQRSTLELSLALAALGLGDSHA